MTNLPSNRIFTIPASTYSDGTIQIKVKRNSGYTLQAKVSEIWIEEESQGKLSKSAGNNYQMFIPEKFRLFQNYPNPFNPVSTISFDIPQTTQVKLTVYDIQGKIVYEPINDTRNAGRYSVQFDGGNLSSGVYLYELVAGKYREVKKMTLVR